ncbi:MAG: hypothetical protein ACRDRL_29610, partial [Sciscionella sp.]
MTRVLIFATLILLALVLAPGHALAQQSKGKSTLSGIVIGPDDKPAAHATISYQYSDGSGPHST